MKLALVEVSGDGARESALSAPLWAVILVAAAAALALTLTRRRAAAPPPAADYTADQITPLNARDPSALVMSPGFNPRSCSCPCPEVRKP